MNQALQLHVVVQKQPFSTQRILPKFANTAPFYHNPPQNFMIPNFLRTNLLIIWRIHSNICLILEAFNTIYTTSPIYLSQGTLKKRNKRKLLIHQNPFISTSYSFVNNTLLGQSVIKCVYIRVLNRTCVFAKLHWRVSNRQLSENDDFLNKPTRNASALDFSKILKFRQR